MCKKDNTRTNFIWCEYCQSFKQRRGSRQIAGKTMCQGCFEDKHITSYSVKAWKPLAIVALIAALVLLYLGAWVIVL